MPTIKVSTVDLNNQADLHNRIAQFYEDAAGKINEQAVPILQDLQEWVSSKGYQGNKGSSTGNHQETYDQWHRNYTAALLQEASQHRLMAQQLSKLASDYQQAEQSMSGNDSTGPVTPGHTHIS